MQFRVGYQFPDIDDKGHASKEEAIIVNSAGYEEEDDPGGTLSRKRGRVDYYLAYNHAGKMKVKMEGVVREVEAGSVFLYKPYEEQYYGQYDRRRRMANYWVHFTGFGIVDLLMKAGIPGSGIYVTGPLDELPPLFERMIAEIVQRKPYFPAIAAAILQQIVYLISQRLTLNEKLQKLQGRELMLSKALQFMHANYMRPIAVSQLATLCGLSRSRFADLFKQETGQSPQQYAISLRLQKAKEFLGGTSLNIRQISMLCGYDDQLYFSRLFRKYGGVTPSQYREIVREKKAKKNG